MDNFSVIYKILKQLEKAMDYDEFDMDTISCDTLKITENRWLKIMEMLYTEKYIDGISVKYGSDSNAIISVRNPRITLKGLEYLENNTMMKKAANFLKGVKDTIPGM